MDICRVECADSTRNIAVVCKSFNISNIAIIVTDTKAKYADFLLFIMRDNLAVVDKGIDNKSASALNIYAILKATCAL